MSSINQNSLENNNVLSRKPSFKAILQDISNIFRNTKSRSTHNYDSSIDASSKLSNKDASTTIINKNTKTSLSKPNECIEESRKILEKSSQPKFYSKNLVNHVNVDNSSKYKVIISDNNVDNKSDKFTKTNSRNQSRILQLLAPLSATKVFLCDKDYRKKIYQYLKYYETIACNINENYLKNHFFINKDHRLLLFDWMIDLQLDFRLDDTIIHKAYTYIDIFLNRTKNFKKDRLQLLAITSIFVASKIQERSPIALSYLSEYCHFKCKSYEILEFEYKLVATLNYILNIPIAYEYLESWAYMINLNAQFLSLVTFVVECSRMCYELVAIPPSLLASASFFLSLKLMNIFYNEEKWNRDIFPFTHYHYCDVEILARKINFVIKKNLKKMKNVMYKYSAGENYYVSKFEFFDDKEFGMIK